MREIVKAEKDHLVIIDIGPAKNVKLRIESIGKELDTIEKNAIII